MGVLLLLLLGAAGYQAAVLAVMVVGWRTPRVPHRRDPSSLGLAFETVRFPTAGGKTLHGWWIPSGRSGAPVLVLVHGWTRNVERMLPYAAMLHPAGYDLLIFDARHHGSSDEDGFASMPKFSQDIRAAVDYLRSSGLNAQGPVGVVGLSVGGSAAIHAAAHDGRIAAVATVGAFADPRDPRATLGRFWWILAPGLPLAFRYVERKIGFRLKEVAPEAVIGRARARFLLIHGAKDTVIPLAHGRRLAAAAGEKAELWVVPGRGHSDPHLEAAMAGRLAAFFGETLAPGVPSRPAPPAKPLQSAR